MSKKPRQQKSTKAPHATTPHARVMQKMQADSVADLVRMSEKLDEPSAAR